MSNSRLDLLRHARVELGHQLTVCRSGRGQFVVAFFELTT
jgi:hypothetical protein